MLKQSINLLNVLFLFFFSACGNFDEIKSNPRASGVVFEFDFEAIKEDVFKPNNCTECHKQYNDYSTVRKLSNKILSAVLENRMPKNGPAVSFEQKQKLTKWVNDGAPEFKEANGEFVEETLEPNWESIFKNVISLKCLDCHNPERKIGGLDFSTLETFRDTENRLIIKPSPFLDTQNPANSYLISIITDPNFPMPPSDSNIDGVSLEEVGVIMEWIKNGLKETVKD